MTHICVGNVTIIGSDNGLAPGRHQVIIWTNVGILSIASLGTKFIEILIAIHIFSFNKMHLKMSSANWQPFYLSFNVLIHCCRVRPYCNIILGQHWPRQWLVVCWHQSITWTDVDIISDVQRQLPDGNFTINASDICNLGQNGGNIT